MIQLELTSKLFNVFTKKEKKIFYYLLSFQIIIVILEILSIGSLLPIFKVIVDPVWNEKYFYFFPQEYLIPFLLTLVVSFFIIKNILIVTLIYFTGKFKNSVTLRIIDDIFNGYLKKNYLFHLENNSSILIRNVQYASKMNSTIERLVNFYADLILFLFAIVLLIFFLNFKHIIFVSIVLFLIFGIYTLLTSFKLKKSGRSDVKYNTLFLKNMIEGLSSHKEILLNNKQDYFKNRNFFFKTQSLILRLKLQILETIPRNLIEITFVSLIITLSIYLIFFSEKEITELLPLIGVLVVAIIKVSPNFLRLFLTTIHFKYLIAEVDTVIEVLKNLKQSSHYDHKIETQKEIIFNKKITVKNLSFVFKDKKILNQINFEIPKESIIGIRGISGSGKTTLLNILSGLLKPSSGDILIDDKKTDLNNFHWHKGLSFMSQNTYLLDDTIKKNIAFGINEQEIDTVLVDECIEKAGLKNFVKSLKNGIETVVGEKGTKISGGQTQRIGLARAFYKKPSILLLDEPTSSLDRENEKKIIDTIKKLKSKITILIVSHDTETLKIADTLYTIEKGELQK